MLSINQPAPEFNLSDQAGKNHQLNHYRGKWVVLYFYPKDNTPGCTKEACSFRDNWSKLKQDAVVLGVSADSVESHKRFASKHQLPFPLLSDPDKQTLKAYQVWGPKKFMGREFLGIKRASYLINPQGVIAKIYASVKPDEHAAQVANDIKTLQSKD